MVSPDDPYEIGRRPATIPPAALQEAAFERAVGSDPDEYRAAYPALSCAFQEGLDTVSTTDVFQLMHAMDGLLVGTDPGVDDHTPVPADSPASGDVTSGDVAVVGGGAAASASGGGGAASASASGDGDGGGGGGGAASASASGDGGDGDGAERLAVPSLQKLLAVLRVARWDAGVVLHCLGSLLTVRRRRWVV